MATACIETAYSREAKMGYGRCRVVRFGRRIWLAHVLAWVDAHGMLPPEDKPCVLHHCDNPPCVNPDHLYAGTRADNARDKSQRGRDLNSRKTCCPKCGGSYTRYVWAGRPQRECRSCTDDRVRDRYAKDENYRERRLEIGRESYRRNWRERYANDPELRDRRRALQRARYAARKSGAT